MCAGVFASFSGDALAQRLTLRINEAKFPEEDASVEFSTPIPQRCPEFSGPLDLPFGESDSFRVYLDRDRIETRFERGFARYHFYVQPKETSGGADVSCFAAQAIPRGSFQPRLAEVEFLVGTDRRESGRLEIPVFSRANIDRPYLRIDPADPVYSLRVGQPLSVNLGLENLLQDLPVEVKGLEDLRFEGQAAVWNTEEAQLILMKDDAEPVLTIPPGPAPSAIRLEAQPDRVQTMLETIVPLGPDEFHTGILFTIEYGVPNGPERHTLVTLNVRFTPSLMSLVGAVIVGALVGVTIVTLGSGGWSLRVWGRGALGGVLLGLVVEAIGWSMVLGGSEFRLFALELDPTQLMPAAVAGVFCGLFGFRGADLLERYLPKGALRGGATDAEGDEEES